MTTDDLTATLTQALTDEPYLLADVLCAHAHQEQRMTPMTGFVTERGLVVSCALCKASSFELAGNFAANLAPMVAALIAAAEQAADEKWMRWLIERLHYGIDTSCEVDPPCTLADYAAMWEHIEPGQEFMAEAIVAETGCWADELTDTDDGSK